MENDDIARPCAHHPQRSGAQSARQPSLTDPRVPTRAPAPHPQPPCQASTRHARSATGVHSAPEPPKSRCHQLPHAQCRGEQGGEAAAQPSQPNSEPPQPEPRKWESEGETCRQAGFALGSRSRNASTQKAGSRTPSLRQPANLRQVPPGLLRSRQLRIPPIRVHHRNQLQRQERAA